MDKDLKSGIKKLLLLDSLIVTSNSITRIIDEAEEELEEIFGKPRKNDLKVEELIKNKNIK